MDIKKLVENYLQRGKVIQLATSKDGQPWVCSVYYVIDGKLNIYWLSLPSRRHSQEVVANGKIAITVAVKLDQPIIGVQAEGTVGTVSEYSEVRKVSELYVAKHNTGKDFYENFVDGKNKHSMYKFMPKKIVLFDEVNFPGDPRQEWDLA